MKFIYKLIFFAFLIVLLGFEIPNYKKNRMFFNQEDDKILWSSKRKLVWDDFKGIVPETIDPFVVALTCSNIKIDYNFVKNGILHYTIQNHFIKSKSWTVTSDTQTLAHEQLHFDIAELYARKIRKSFDSLKVRKYNKQETYNEIYHSNISKCGIFQDLYDYQVSGNNKNQQQWIKKVGAELARLKRYEYILEE